MPIPGAVPAPMAKRLLAFVIDQVASLLVGGAFVIAGTLPVLSPVQESVGTAPPAEPASPLLLVGSVLMLAFGLVQWWYLGSRGFTVGKRLVGLRTLSVDTGRPVGMGRALVRLLVPAVSVLALGVGPVVVYASPFFDPTGRRRGWHDKAAGTMVFDVTVGRDPATATRSTDRMAAPAAARRIDSLLGDERSEDGRLVDRWHGDDRQGESLHGDRRHDVATEPRLPALTPVRLTPALVPTADEDAAVDDGRQAQWEPVGVGRRPAGAEHGAGVIAAVPGASDVRPEAPQPSPSPVTAEPTLRPTVQPYRPQAAPCGLAPDVEATRLRPARGKVPEVAAGPTQPVAVIDLTDGRRIDLTGTALVGRRPAPRPEDGDVELIAVSDPARSVSKTHLAIGVDRVGVWVRDRDSTNGTVVTLADGQQILCAAEQQVRIGVGASVAFGDYGLTVIEDSPPARPYD